MSDERALRLAHDEIDRLRNELSVAICERDEARNELSVAICERDEARNEDTRQLRECINAARTELGEWNYPANPISVCIRAMKDAHAKLEKRVRRALSVGYDESIFTALDSNRENFNKLWVERNAALAERDTLQAEIDAARTELGDWDDADRPLADCILTMNEAHTRDTTSMRKQIATLTAARDDAEAEVAAVNAALDVRWQPIDGESLGDAVRRVVEELAEMDQ